MIGRQEFLEHARVFDHWYGTSRAQVAALIEQGLTVLLEIDWQGARQVRGAAPDSVSVFIMPPSVGVLEERLRRRASDSDAVIARRLRDALDEMSHWDEFDFVIINDDLDQATRALQGIVRGEAGGGSTRDPATIARVTEILGDSGS
jgi:guanylate kinase